MTTDNVVPIYTTPNVLYSVLSVVPEWTRRHGVYKDVCISWFVCSRELPYAPERIIAGWDAIEMDEMSADYAKRAADELMTKDEASQLVEFLKDYPSTESIHEHPLPLEGYANIMPTGGIPVGGSSDFYMLSKSDSYSLPFKVWGYFDVEGAELLYLLPCEECRREKPREVFGLWEPEMTRSRYVCADCLRSLKPDIAKAVIEGYDQTHGLSRPSLIAVGDEVISTADSMRDGAGPSAA